MPPPANQELSDSSSDLISDLSDEDETKEDEDRVPLEQFATNEQFAATLELLQLPPAERSRENVECIFDLVRDNKFFAELDAEMSLELCRHMTYTTLKQDRVVFYKGDPADNWYLILAGKAGVYIEELKDAPEREGGDQGDLSPKQRQGLIRNDVRSAALVTHSDSLFLTLDKKSFQHCLGNFLKQKTDDKVQTLRQVLPGAKELRKLVVEQLTYFFKEATLQKDVPLSTEGNREDTLYLIVKGDISAISIQSALGRQRANPLWLPSVSEGEGSTRHLGVGGKETARSAMGCQVVSRALRQQRDKVARDSSRPATAGSRSSSLPPASIAADCAWNQDRAMLPELNGSPRNGKTSQPSVLLEELDLALLQEGCIVNFCSLFFDSPEPFSVFAFSAKTQVFSISKSELFKHMPPSVLDAVRVTGLLLLQHLERRIGKQEERIRRLEQLHQRDATQSSGDFAAAENNSGFGGASSGTNRFLLPLTFSPFLSQQMGEYIDASSMSLASHFDRFTRNLLCFQPHTAVLNYATFQLLQQQKQRRTQRQQAASSEKQSDLRQSEAQKQKPVPAPSPAGAMQDNSEASSALAAQAGPTANAKGGTDHSSTPQHFSQVIHGALASQKSSETKPGLSPLHRDDGQGEQSRPHEAPSSSGGAGKRGSTASLNIVKHRPGNFLAKLTGDGSHALAPGGTGASRSTKPGDVITSAELPGTADANALTEAIAAREAAACAASALALGHPIVSDSGGSSASS
ncbi:cyclic nucleotide-binding domain containing protein, putative [Eimeria brunetti]|uniref:Cyclic nucleotide-binding domain containing protein, putative n=1 Tax=Eimeria brunetti TaxID=51314 RepID=U6LQD4_9EIME|nr:cyclic nucleotide-binding domain containing protein, putative [Eimeria brunetti]